MVALGCALSLLRRPDDLARAVAVVTRVELLAAVREHEHHVERVAARRFHPRRAGGHAGDRETARFRPLAQQPRDFTRGDVALDGVAVDDCRMAAAELLGDAVLPALDRRIVHEYRVHTEPVGAQVFRPRAAAASVGVLILRDRAGLGLRGRRARCRYRHGDGHRRDEERRGEEQSSHDRFPECVRHQ